MAGKLGFKRRFDEGPPWVDSRPVCVASGSQVLQYAATSVLRWGGYEIDGSYDYASGDRNVPGDPAPPIRVH